MREREGMRSYAIHVQEHPAPVSACMCVCAYRLLHSVCVCVCVCRGSSSPSLEERPPGMRKPNRANSGGPEGRVWGRGEAKALGGVHLHERGTGGPKARDGPCDVVCAVWRVVCGLQPTVERRKGAYPVAAAAACRCCCCQPLGR